MRIAFLIIIGLVFAQTNTATAAPLAFAVFPVVGGAHYTNDFGDPRGGGTHEGNDLMSPCGTPVVAVVAGTMQLDYGSRSGWMITLTGKRSWYRYIHLGIVGKRQSALAPGLKDGSVVREGQVISYVGNTGDAAGGACHLHFELHSGNRVVSPYTTLQAATILDLDPNNPAMTSPNTRKISLTITGTIVWIVSTKSGGRLLVRPTTIRASDGSSISHSGIIVIKADPTLLSSVHAGERAKLVTAVAPLTSERLDLKAMSWSIATATRAQ